MNLRKLSIAKQIIISISIIIFIALLCYLLINIIDYKIVALILLMTVSSIAMLFEIVPVILSATISAIVWNFFFIPPIFTFHINDTQDILMFLLYFFIALINAVLSVKIRDAEKKARDKEERERELKLYNNLLNSLSHELRTPITAIIGSVDILKENNSVLSKENENILLDEISNASIRLNAQVENLLNISRIESGHLLPKYDWCDINEIINSVIKKLPSTNNHKIIFNSQSTIPYFKIDGIFLDQIIYNILYNAILYTPINTIISIDVHQVTNHCRIIISDNGLGFNDEELKSIFNKFYRGKNTKTGGTGLGLSISKGFVEAMNGEIVVENNDTGGAKFTITIPSEFSDLNNIKNE